MKPQSNPSQYIGRRVAHVYMDLRGTVIGVGRTDDIFFIPMLSILWDGDIDDWSTSWCQFNFV